MSLSDSTKVLEANYTTCYNLLGELLATLTLASNREKLQADPALLQPLFDIADTYTRQFANLKDISSIQRLRYAEDSAVKSNTASLHDELDSLKAQLNKANKQLDVKTQEASDAVSLNKKVAKK